MTVFENILIAIGFLTTFFSHMINDDRARSRLQ